MFYLEYFVINNTSQLLLTGIFYVIISQIFVGNFKNMKTKIESFKELYDMATELGKFRTNFPYRYIPKQKTTYNDLDHFLYECSTFETIHRQAIRYKDKVHTDYLMSHWYNFWSARCVDFLLAQHSLDIKFEHNFYTFPPKWTLKDAKEKKDEFIKWLYLNRCNDAAPNYKNRLFIIAYSKKKTHWKAKANIHKLRLAINEYMEKFNMNNLSQPFDGVYSDVIWLEG